MLDPIEYNAIKEKELEHAKEVAEYIKNEKRDIVKYRDSRPITDIKHMIKTSVEEYGDNIAFHVKKAKGQPYSKVTYNEFYDDMNALGTSLINLGLKDKRIAVIGENSYEWAISYLATVCGTGIVVPLDKELGIRELAQFVSDAEVSAVIFSKKYEKMFKEIKDSGETLIKNLINMNATEHNDDVLSYEQLVKEGKELVASGDMKFIDAQIQRDVMSILLFTSGTTGVSKGVMLSHGNIAEDLMVAPTVLKVNTWDIFFSVLPLHHTYECTCGFLMPLYKGASVAYCEGLKYITKNLQEVKPTMFLGVPAIFEKLYSKIWLNVKKQGKEKKLKKAIKINNITKKVGIDLSKKLFKDIQAVFGGNMRLMIAGGAAINPEVLDGIRDFGINAVQGYGLTECAPLAALNPDTKPNPLSIGMQFPLIDLEIHNKNEEGIGEICVRGANVMLGYYNMPEATAEALADGVFHTGDLGYIDENGYAYITGRKKNVIITKNGKNVYPEELEYLVNLSDEIAECMVFEGKASEKDDDIIAISVVLDEELLEELYDEKLSYDDRFKIVKSIVDKVNDTQPVFKQIKRIILRDKELKKNTSNKIIRFAEENKK